MDHKWVNDRSGHVPRQAVVAGFDSGGDTMYIGRALHNGNYLPAKIVPNKGKGYICYSGEEIEVNSYEVLSGLHYVWVHAANGQVPHGAVKVGKDGDENLYAGRGQWEGSLSVGKVHPSHGCLYIPYGGEEVKLTEYEVLVQPDKWIDATADSIPEGALQAGHDVDGDAIYVGRVKLGGDTMPAKIIPAKGGAYVSWGSEEKKLENFEVLVGAGFEWVNCANGSVAPGAVSTGKTSDGEALYVGRAEHKGSLCVGKVHPSEGCLYLPFDGEEIKVLAYEILVKS